MKLMKDNLVILGAYCVVISLGLLLPEPATEWWVSAYCPCERCCSVWADGITASGHIIEYGDRLVAAPSILAFGTMVMVPGYNNNRPVPILDRGGAIHSGRLDVLFYEKSQDPKLTDLEWSHQKALEWGVQFLQIKFVGE